MGSDHYYTSRSLVLFPCSTVHYHTKGHFAQSTSFNVQSSNFFLSKEFPIQGLSEFQKTLKNVGLFYLPSGVHVRK